MTLVNKVKMFALGGFTLSAGVALFNYLNNTKISSSKPVVEFKGGPLFKKCVKEIKIVVNGATPTGACRFLYGSR